MLAPSPTHPTISIIVPARNEEASLGRCLASLVSQEGVNFEIIVVDDGSTDRTREIANSFLNVSVIYSAPLQQNWTGKNNAVFTATREAHGEWLLFTDADTEHRPGSLGRALAEAQWHNASMLSYSPEQEVHTFWEKALMPVIFAELAATYRPLEVSNPNSRAAAANGQYILISREVYDEVGGHATVAASFLEDVDLARAVKNAGHKIHFRYAADAVCTRMYQNFSELKEGWTKNLALLFPSPIKLATLRLTESTLIVGSVITSALFAKFNTAIAAAAALTALLFISKVLFRIKKAHFSWPTTAVSLLGLPLFSYLLIRSRTKRQVIWKGRTYASATKSYAGTAAAGCPAEPSSAAI